MILSFGPLPKAILAGSVKTTSLSGTQLLSAQSDVRAALLQAVAGFLLVIGAITAWRQVLIAKRQHLLDRHTAVTEAFTKAIECLGNAESLDVRLGGIYSLDRVANDDPAERTRIAEILSTYVREHALDGRPLSRDVAAVMSILTSRNWPINLDLSRVSLPAAPLTGANLRNAYLSDANLSGATLRNACLQDADLARTDLRQADLSGANLSGSNLSQARLSAARANSFTKWPNDFVPTDHGILIS